MSEAFVPPPVFGDAAKITNLSNDVIGGHSGDPPPLHYDRLRDSDQSNQDLGQQLGDRNSNSDVGHKHDDGAAMDVDTNNDGASTTVGRAGIRGSMSNETLPANMLGHEAYMSSEDPSEGRHATTFSSATHEPQMPDLVTAVRGMYRVLDLINEQGSGGLVDKIIIAQDSLGRLMNDLRPGSYTSMTKVDFNALDTISVKPTGIYGSKNEIVRFLETLGSIDKTIAHSLRTENSQSISAARPRTPTTRKSSMRYTGRKTPPGITMRSRL
ncbi:hypothetical protein POSPLADRAFT_1047623 [Postia placenta MAD-698-R-SB12]|uniref:Uncharacterized protein n=1 Tax=Postia placenta MAD-698-R-SB12 TaxID=670580 RepID=A0A1X6MV96_9APHY|nr:hypothetical protein POSPLADRAFT_1047623 [Postia placenta MAD-698-R-SB12]OSX60152.1 hypothetical protein POSPLADRAFT_1047623 [Postia placenta MAD-698-R-SB12]